ncbi:MAG: adenylate/guanylate cyclase domain-containing protein [Dehalococcoidia bacterium]
MEPRIQYAKTSDGVNIAYWAEGEGIPLVIMPPLPWSHLQAELDDSGYQEWYGALAHGKRLVRYDSRGSGLSDRAAAEFSADAYVRDLLTVVDKLQLEEFVLMAIIFSSPIAIEFAAQHPERVSRLAFWCGFSDYAALTMPQDRALNLLRQTDWEMFTETIAHATVAGWAEPERARAAAELFRRSVEPEVLEIYTGLEFDASARLKEIRCPTLVMHRNGVTRPPLETSRKMAAEIEDCQFVLLEGDSMLPYVGDTNAVVETVNRFLGISDDTRTKTIAASVSVHEDRPGAIHTILFTDVEGSTALTQRLGDVKARDLLREHERITREALAAHGGSEVKTMGDGFMASFGSATAALECAIAIQRAFAEHNASADEPIRVRIGLNAGEPISEEDPDGRGDLFGTAVNMAARICAKAEGGQILASIVVRELVAGKGFLLSDVGETDLRGFEDPVRLYEVRWREDEDGNVTGNA